MAISAPTFIQPLANDHTNVGKIVVVDVTLDSSYPTGGESFDPHQLGLSEVWFTSVVQTAPLTTSWIFRYNIATSKILAYCQSDSDNDQPLEEVPNTTDLSTATVRLFFYGLPS